MKILGKLIQNTEYGSRTQGQTACVNCFVVQPGAMRTGDTLTWVAVWQTKNVKNQSVVRAMLIAVKIRLSRYPSNRSGHEQFPWHNAFWNKWGRGGFNQSNIRGQPCQTRSKFIGCQCTHRHCVSHQKGQTGGEQGCPRLQLKGSFVSGWDIRSSVLARQGERQSGKVFHVTVNTKTDVWLMLTWSAVQWRGFHDILFRFHLFVFVVQEMAL